MALTATRDNFYSERLAPHLRGLYEACVDNLGRGVLATSYDLGAAADGQDLQSVAEAVLCGCPELFFVDQQAEVGLAGSTATIRFTSKYGDVAKCTAELDREIERIAAKVRQCTGTYNKILRIAKYLTVRVAGENGNESTLGDAYGALILRKARCEGYAKAAKLIMDRVGIRSVIAIGTAARGGDRFPHAWNIAYVGENAYAFDFAWAASGSMDGVPGADYLFLPDEVMRADHTPRYPYPACTDATQTFWARSNGLVKYRSDLARVKILPSDRSFIGVVRFEDERCAKQLKEDVPRYLADEMYEKGRSFKRVGYAYNEPLRVLTVFFVND